MNTFNSFVELHATGCGATIEDAYAVECAIKEIIADSNRTPNPSNHPGTMSNVLHVD